MAGGKKRRRLQKNAVAANAAVAATTDPVAAADAIASASAPRCESPAPDLSDSSDVEILSVSFPAATGGPPKRRRRGAATKAAAAQEKDEAEEEETDPEADVIEAKPAAKLAANEVDAVLGTEEASSSGRKQEDDPAKPQRRLLEFVVHDESGDQQPIEMLEDVPLYITSVVLPVTGLLEKKRGLLCQCFGPIESWSISGYEDGKPVVWISTDVADYVCSKPAAGYKNWYFVLADKSAMCVAVFKALGSKPELPLESLVATMARVSKKSGLSQPFSREYLVSIGGFVCEQVTGLDESASDGDQVFAGLPALVSLEKEWSASRKMDAAGPRSGRKPGTLTIREPGEAANSPSEYSSDLTDQQQHGDAQLAQLLQEQEDRSARRRTGGTKKNYIKINEDELAADYPMPEFYKADEEEADEYLVMDESGELEYRMLHGWALYNSDMRFVSLELLPMASGAETDMEVFGSGFMTEDNEEYRMDDDQGDSTSTTDMLRIYLSSIKEWKIEFGAEFLSISIRTAGAWYRLGSPSAEYTPWYTPVLKTAKVARHILSMLKNESRISRVPFPDVIKRLAEQSPNRDTYIGSKVSDVERYVVVHGQILLQQFSEYPDVNINRCSFVGGLTDMMVAKHHTKLKISKKKLIRGTNLNPRASLQPDVSKTKQMRATTTQLINRIWSEYYSKFGIDDSDTSEPAAAEANQVQDDQKPKEGNISVQSVNPGEAVRYGAESGDDVFLLVEHTYKSGGRNFVHGRVMVKGENTVLGNAASDRELFLTEQCDDVSLKDAKEIVSVELRRRPWGYMHKSSNAAADEEDRNRARDREAGGLPTEFFCQALYVPDKGGFFRIPHEKLAQGTGTCESCKCREAANAAKGLSLFADRQGFRIEGVEYRILDFVYLEATEAASQNQDDGETIKGGRNKGRRAYTIGQLLEVKPASGKNTKTAQLTVRKLYRPEDVDAARAYKADVHEVYYCEQTSLVALGSVRGKCTVVKLQDFNLASQTENLFFCSCVYDPEKGTVKQLPANVRLGRVAAVKSASSSKAKGKGKLVEDDEHREDENSACKLSMLDIFAGCGGLSEGLHQSGIASTKWAIEYDRAAADAFKANHPAANVFCENCNVILRSIMELGGDLDDCCSPPEAAEMAAKLTEEQKKNLPMPGDVDFICGGPPCQGFSGMNRFNQRAWSKVQCEMILGFLSYADYFRPRYFLLENVRNFVSFNKGQTFRLTLASLLAMGYQVRFGVLQAGHYGVSQSRTRAFIWAAAPDEVLPEWPEPMHVFASSQLKIPLPGNSSYAAVHDTCRGAPLRSMTVRDTIEDLPAVTNGTENPEIPYGNAPQSWFQKNIRGDANLLLDHICKEMNELNLIRCERIPKRPGADWRDLPDEKVKLSTGQTVDLIPWCLPNTADRHNQWKGLFGRLDWDGNFPTSITDPQPMGKVGMCFHPVQNRIVTVRECARSQGFRDSYRFHGTMQSKHRQIGNAVPPPLAKALGDKLREAVHGHA